MSGQETEMDKTMVELIGDPLVHLIRNALDHGIELPDQRAQAGKARCGTVRLEACQEGDQIVVTVADDGIGIDPDRIARKAVDKGLVTPERLRALTAREVLDFIFVPGFSTAERVNNLSGRGVGMDVVRSNLRKLNGTVELDSALGQGTTVRLHLPLTLAILPVLLVEVANEIYALPLRCVIETMRVRKEQLHSVDGREVIRVRLSHLFAADACHTQSAQQKKAVILSVGDQQVALLVDELIGQESTVIKPLGTHLHHDASLSGATISGDGRVRLVLDPAGLIASASSAGVVPSHGVSA
jgi:two-component system chemotaxis sensor kinase CheA